AARVLAAGAAHPEARLQGPGVARPDREVYDAVAKRGWRDRDIVDRAVAADQALGLFDQAHRDALAALEEEEPPNEARARGDVQRVRRAIGKTAFLRIVEVEDVVRIDDDLADDGAGGLELGERRELLRVRGGGDQRQQPRQQAGRQNKRGRGR